MVNELTKEAQNNNVRFFTVQRKFSGIAHNTVYIYCSDISVMEDIKKECNVEKKVYDSVFFGKTSINNLQVFVIFFEENLGHLVVTLKN